MIEKREGGEASALNAMAKFLRAKLTLYDDNHSRICTFSEINNNNTYLTKPAKPRCYFAFLRRFS